MLGRSVSHYRVVERLGEGGMGVVYRAEDTRLGRAVALKFLPGRLAADRGALERFQREARAASALNHPHICTIYDIDEADGQPFIAMELLEGESLRARVTKTRVPVPALIDIGTQLADALEGAHAKGVVHRDVKPENIFVTTRGTVKLLDFGIAKLAIEQGAAAVATVTATRVGTGPVALGTVAYMSPEQVRGESLDGRTDLFSLGVVLYELTTGVQPFRGTTSGAVLGEILTKAPTAPVRLNADVPPDLERIINKLLEKDRELRYQSAREVRVDLERLRRTLAEPTSASRPQADERPSIVVLPFENLSPDPDNAFFADGLTEEIIADLSKVRGLRVISRTSAMLLKAAKKDLPTIGRELNVRYVLEGSVRRAGNHLRITAQLIEAPNDAHLWAEKYTGTLDDVFEIQEKVSRTIVDALKVRLTPEEDRSLAARQLPDARTFDLYLRAQQEMYRMTGEGLDRASALIEQALAITGPNAVLYATLGQIQFHYHDAAVRADEATLTEAKAWADRALALAPDCPPAYVVKGLLAWKHGEMGQAVVNMRRAVDLGGGGQALAWLAHFCFESGRMRDARQAAEQAASADPLFWLSRWALAIASLGEGRFDQAELHMLSADEATGGEPLTKMFLAPLLLYAGKKQQAAAVYEELGRANAGLFTDIGQVIGAMLNGDRAAAERAIEATSLVSFARGDRECSWFLTLGFVQMGDYDAALGWLENTINVGFCNHRFWSETDPVIAPLRGHPRFAALMVRAKEKERLFLMQT